MFQVEHIEIAGFWGKYKATVDLHPDVNIFIGRNGSGKTTFINLLQAVLRVDLQALSSYDFESVRIRLRHDKRVRSVSVTREQTGNSMEILRFKVGTRCWIMPLFSSESDITRQWRLRPHRQQEYLELKDGIRSLIRVASLSVHRTMNERSPDEDYVSRQRRSVIPAIDQRLNELILKLTSYQLLLAESANQVSSRFQKNVLVSMLYDEEFDTFNLAGAQNVELKKEKEDLSKAYKELDALDPTIAKRIDQHIGVLQKSINAAKEAASKPVRIDDIMPLPLLRRTQHIIKLSRQAESEKQVVSLPIRRFIGLLGGFITDKNIEITSAGDLIMKKDESIIPILELSSGEKQLLIVLTETLLQKNEPFVFVADEPELSLHVGWQEKVISSIQELNANAQVIIATHSPEIAAGWKSRVFDMQDIIHG